MSAPRNGRWPIHPGRSAQAGFTDDGGSTTDLSTATCTLTGTGKRHLIDNPAEEGSDDSGGGDESGE